MKRRSVLVTGGMGFVGVHTALKFMDEGYETILYDIAEREIDVLEERKGQWAFVMGDVRDWWNVLETVKKYEVEGVVHTTLIQNPDYWNRFHKVTKPNFDACHTLLEICWLEKLKFVFISSNVAYGYRPDSNPMIESDFAPRFSGAFLDEYGAMKQMCEALTTMYHYVHRVDSVSCRISWVYGPGTRGHLVWYPQWFLANALAGNPVKLEKGGDHKTDYSYVKDVALGVYLAFTVRPLKHRLYNITSGEKVSARNAAEIVKKIVPGAEIEIGPGQMEKGIGNLRLHPLQMGTMLITQAKEDLGYTTTSLEQGLKETAEWYRKLPEISVAPLIEPLK
jgi:nucleoside-diphosphate-sugar epimerase